MNKGFFAGVIITLILAKDNSQQVAKLRFDLDVKAPIEKYKWKAVVKTAEAKAFGRLLI